VNQVTADAELFEVVGTLDPGRRFTDFLDGGKQQANQNGDDPYHHQ
jgi:hypothetical protein